MTFFGFWGERLQGEEKEDVSVCVARGAVVFLGSSND